MTLITAIALFWLGGLQEPEALFGSRIHAIYSLNIATGGFNLYQLPLGSIRPNDQLEGILKTENCQAELEITPVQAQKIAKAFRDLQEGLLRFSSDKRDNSAAQIAEIKEIIAEFSATVDETLLDHQQERLQQLLRRLAIWKHGVFLNLESQPIPGVQPLGDRRSQLIEKLTQVLPDLKTQATASAQRYFNDVLSVLTPTQRERFEEKYGEFWKTRIPFLEVLVFQANNREFYKKTVEGAAKDPYSGFRLITTFELDYDGTIFATQIGGVRNGIGILDDASLASAVLGYLEMELIQTDLELTAAQMAVIKDLGDLLIAVTRSESDWWAAKANREIEEMLDQTQKEQLETWSERVELLAGGIGFALCDGKMSDKLRVSTEQKEKIGKIEREFVENVAQQFDLFEQKIFDCLLEVLDAEEKRAFNAAIGPPPKHMGGNIELMLFQAKSYCEGKHLDDWNRDLYGPRVIR